MLMIIKEEHYLPPYSCRVLNRWWNITLHLLGGSCLQKAILQLNITTILWGVRIFQIWLGHATVRAWLRLDFINIIDLNEI